MKARTFFGSLLVSMALACGVAPNPVDVTDRTANDGQSATEDWMEVLGDITDQGDYAGEQRCLQLSVEAATMRGFGYYKDQCLVVAWTLDWDSQYRWMQVEGGLWVQECEEFSTYITGRGADLLNQQEAYFRCSGAWPS